MGVYSTETMTRDEVLSEIMDLLYEAMDDDLCDVLACLKPGSYHIEEQNVDTRKT